MQSKPRDEVKPSLEIMQIDGSYSAIFFDQVANIHRREITEGFLSSLGDKFLAELYRLIAGSQSALLCAAVDRDRNVHGFICASVNTRQVYSDVILKNGHKILPKLLPRVLTISRIRKVLETVLYPRSKKNQQKLPASEILNFCVRSDRQGMGIGQDLFAFLVSNFRERGVKELKIVTGGSQLQAARFYEQQGAKLLTDEIEIHKGVSSKVFCYYL